jgi:hypothetical protein
MSKKYTFIDIANSIFINKNSFNEIPSEDKECNFFIINKKISLGNIKNIPLLKQAQFLNSKFIDKNFALNIWFNFFKNKNINDIPFWWYKKSNKEKEKTKKIGTNKEIEYIQNFNELSEKDILFLKKYYPEELELETKKIKKYESED